LIKRKSVGWHGQQKEELNYEKHKNNYQHSAGALFKNNLPPGGNTAFSGGFNKDFTNMKTVTKKYYRGHKYDLIRVSRDLWIYRAENGYICLKPYRSANKRILTLRDVGKMLKTKI
jgi:hypothetical protein